MSRYDQSYGTYLDRQANPVHNQGAVMANAAYDLGAKIAIQTENERVAPSAYGNAGQEDVWNIDPHEILFRLAGQYDSGVADSRCKVLGSLNGLGVQATLAYPDNEEMQRQAVLNQIIPVGVAYQQLRAVRGEVERGIAVQLGGLHTLRLGNGQFAEPEDTTIRPGDIVAVDVPAPGQRGLHPGPGGRIRKGTPATKYTLQLRRANHRSAAQALLLHLHEANRNPAKWRRAMGAHLLGTNAWESAVRNIQRSYDVYAALAVGQLVRAGAVSLTGDFAALSSTANAAADLTGASAAVLVGELLGALSPTRLEGGITALGNAALRRELRLTQARVHAAGFHRASDINSEFGYDAATKLSAARNLTTDDDGKFRVNGSPAGKLLLEQLNHLPRAVSAFHYAVQRDLALIIGKATTGGSDQGSGNVHVYLGLNGT